MTNLYRPKAGTIRYSIFLVQYRKSDSIGGLDIHLLIFSLIPLCWLSEAKSASIGGWQNKPPKTKPPLQKSQAKPNKTSKSRFLNLICHFDFLILFYNLLTAVWHRSLRARWLSPQ